MSSIDDPGWASGPASFGPDPRITEYPATFVRDWIVLSPDIPDNAFRAYCLIRAHLWEKDEKRQVTLTQEQMAKMLGKSTDRVRKIIKPLLAVGLLSVAGKKTWFEHNPKTNRREKRAMNVYAVTDFPGPDYEGPKSISDFGRRSADTDRSKTTGGQAPEESAGQTDQAKTTGGPSSQVSDISAGQTDRSKTATVLVENDPPYKNSFKKGGEEGDARARVQESSPVLGVQGSRRPAAPTLAAIETVAELARAVLIEGEALTADEHQDLAALLDAAGPVVAEQRGLVWEEYLAWLRQGWVGADGRRKFNDFVGTLKWRLRAEQVKAKAWPWVCEQRGAREASQAAGARPAPAAPPAQRCGRHETTLLDGRCLPCDAEARAEDAAATARANPHPEPADGAEEPPEDLDADTLDNMFASLGIEHEQAKAEARERAAAELAAYRESVAARRS